MGKFVEIFKFTIYITIPIGLAIYYTYPDNISHLLNKVIFSIFLFYFFFFLKLKKKILV